MQIFGHLLLIIANLLQNLQHFFQCLVGIWIPVVVVDRGRVVVVDRVVDRTRVECSVGYA